MNIDQHRRYARLMAIARDPDPPLAAWLWNSAQSFELYLFASRYMRRNGLCNTESVVNLQHFESKESA